MNDQIDIQLDNSLSIKEAATYYKVSEKTIRRRIRNGSLPAFQHNTPQGFEWRVQLPTQTVHIDSTSSRTSPTLDNPHNTVRQHHDDTALIKALDLVERLQQENIQLAGQLGFYQAKLQEAEQQIRLLTTHSEEPPIEEQHPTKPWWKRFLTRKSTIDK